ncbi:MAG TPA: amidohydrolase [Egibacteraceae bacterium]|nr:amidohydrolase [Egibacteraceae bacterium]
MRFDTAAVSAAADDLRGRLRAHRRALHRCPELAFEEHRTAAYVESVLTDLGVPHRRIASTGVVGVIRGAEGGCVGVRADMDALPIPEAAGREGYRSEVDGVSHACGHDAHVAVLLGLAELLVSVEALPGTVALYFQPAEEGSGGAAPMVAAGALDDPEPQAIVALHVSSHHPAGVVGLRSGAVSGSTDNVAITVRGVGGHAAHPDTAVDPVPIAAQIVMAVAHVVTREVDPVKPAVVTFGTIHGGTKPNVIAPSVVLGATMRASHPEIRDLLLRRVDEVARAVCATHRATATVSVERGYPAGFNDPALTTIVERAARAVLGDERVVLDPDPSLGAEDFFAFRERGAPVCMFRLGVRNDAKGFVAPHHSPDFDLDEDALPAGVAVFAETIRRLLDH